MILKCAKNKKEVDYNNLPFRFRIYSFASTQAWQNLSSMFFSNGIVGWQNAGLGKVAVVVAAGNSLEKALPILREKQEQVIIVAAGSAIGALTKNGIVPHFVVVVDPFEFVENELSPYLHEKTKLILPFSCSPRIAMQHKGDTYFYSPSKGQLETDVLNDVADFLQTDRLLTSLNVAVTAIGFAMYLGCEPIILTGMDLAIVDSGKHHADGVAASAYPGDFTFIDVMGQNGDILKAPLSFAETVKTLSAVLGPVSDRFINASEGGALIQGIKNKPFAQAVQSIQKKCLLSSSENHQLSNANIILPQRNFPKMAHDFDELMIEIAHYNNYWSERLILCWRICCSAIRGESDLRLLKKEMIDFFSVDLYVHLRPMLVLWQDILEISSEKIDACDSVKLFLFINKTLWALKNLQQSINYNKKVLRVLARNNYNIEDKKAVKKIICDIFANESNAFIGDEHGCVQTEISLPLVHTLQKAILLGEIYCAIPREIMSLTAQGLLIQYIEVLMQLLPLLEKGEMLELQGVLLPIMEAMEKNEEKLVVEAIKNALKKFLLKIGDKYNSLI